MTDITCPLCGKPNPPDRDECLYCQAPLKSSGFLTPSEPQADEGQLFPPPEESGGKENQPASPLEQAIPDWLKETEANFLEPSEAEPEEITSDQISDQIDSLLKEPTTQPSEKEPAIDDDWLASLLEEAGLNNSFTSTPTTEIEQEQSQAGEVEKAESIVESQAEEEQHLPPELVEKPDWLSDLEASSTIKFEGAILPGEPVEKVGGVSETSEAEAPSEQVIPEWVGKPVPEEIPPREEEVEAPIAPAEIPGWLEALRPTEEVSPTGPVEDVSAADVVTAGPLVGLRGVISARPSAFRARKPPTYSVKLRVTDEQRARVEMMEELLANEQKPKPLPSQHIITSRYISRLVIAVVLILPILWMIITNSQQVPSPQPGAFPGVIDFTQTVQTLPVGAPVLLAFDYEAGFSGEMNQAISTVLSQLITKRAYMTLVTTYPSGPALAESLLNSVSSSVSLPESFSYYTDLGYIPGGTMGLLGLAISPRSVLPYSLDGIDVWATSPLDTISSIKDFNAVILLTNDPATARSWIEQVGPVLHEASRPLLIVTSAQAEPLIRPYYEARPSQVQGLIAGLAGGLAYGRTVDNIGQNGLWDAFSIGMTVSVLIIFVGGIIGVVIKMLALSNKKES